MLFRPKSPKSNVDMGLEIRPSHLSSHIAATGRKIWLFSRKSSKSTNEKLKNRKIEKKWKTSGVCTPMIGSKNEGQRQSLILSIICCLSCVEHSIELLHRTECLKRTRAQEKNCFNCLLVRLGHYYTTKI